MSFIDNYADEMLRNFLKYVESHPKRHLFVAESFGWDRVEIRDGYPGDAVTDAFTLHVALDSGHFYYSVWSQGQGSLAPHSVRDLHEATDFFDSWVEKVFEDSDTPDKVEGIRAWSENDAMVESKTGAIKGKKLALYSKIPTAALHALAERYGYGEWKYGDARNWEKGLPWTTHIDALMRHLIAWQSGEDLDPDCPFESSHITAVLYHAAALEHYMAHPEKYAEYDDRAKYGAPTHTGMEALEKS